MSDKNDENNPNCVDVVGAFHAEAGAEPLYAVKLDVVDGNYEDGAAFFKLSKKLSRYFEYNVSTKILLQTIKLD